MGRLLLPAAAVALCAAAAAGCGPPTERSEFNNSGTSAAVGADSSKAPATMPNPPPRIEVAAQDAASAAPPDSSSPPASPSAPMPAPAEKPQPAASPGAAR
jgi:hypothetical protein